MKCMYVDHYHYPLYISVQLKAFLNYPLAKIINNGENVGSKIRYGYWWKHLKWSLAKSYLKLQQWWIILVAKTNTVGYEKHANNIRHIHPLAWSAKAMVSYPRQRGVLFIVFTCYSTHKIITWLQPIIIIHLSAVQLLNL